MKLAFGIFASAASLAVVVILTISGLKAHDLLKTADSVKQSAVESADAIRNELTTKTFVQAKIHQIMHMPPISSRTILS
ncbi:MAG: hypothetical protein P4L87_14260 [Formivibrio sp.]|nr:hypothetical protein [Formivibrio sp.]